MSEFWGNWRVGDNVTYSGSRDHLVHEQELRKLEKSDTKRETYGLSHGLKLLQNEMPSRSSDISA